MRRLIIAAALLAGAQGAWAQFKCLGAGGKTQYQDTPCALDTKETRLSKPPATGRTGPEYKSVVPNMALNAPPQAQPLLDLYRRWFDAETLATSTSRIALSGPVASLQALQREAEAIQVPQCLLEAKKPLAQLVAKTTESFIQFMNKNEVTHMVYSLLDREKLVPEFERAIGLARCD